MLLSSPSIFSTFINCAVIITAYWTHIQWVIFQWYWTHIQCGCTGCKYDTWTMNLIVYVFYSVRFILLLWTIIIYSCIWWKLKWFVIILQKEFFKLLSTTIVKMQKSFTKHIKSDDTLGAENFSHRNEHTNSALAHVGVGWRVGNSEDVTIVHWGKS